MRQAYDYWQNQPGNYRAPGLANGAPERAEEATAAGPERAVEGVLYLPPRESAPGVLVSAVNWLQGTLQGSGPVVKLESISNDVYFRKRK